MNAPKLSLEKPQARKREIECDKQLQKCHDWIKQAKTLTLNKNHRDGVPILARAVIESRDEVFSQDQVEKNMPQEFQMLEDILRAE